MFVFETFNELYHHAPRSKTDIGASSTPFPGDQDPMPGGNETVAPLQETSTLIVKSFREADRGKGAYLILGSDRNSKPAAAATCR